MTNGQLIKSTDRKRRGFIPNFLVTRATKSGCRNLSVVLDLDCSKGEVYLQEDGDT